MDVLTRRLFPSSSPLFHPPQFDSSRSKRFYEISTTVPGLAFIHNHSKSFDFLSIEILRRRVCIFVSKRPIEPSDLWDGISSRSIVKGEGRDSSLCFSYSFLSLPFFFSRKPIQQARTRYAKHNGASLLATDNNESWWQWRFNQLILLSFYLNCESFLIIILSQRNNFRNNFNYWANNFWIRITFPPFQTTFFLRRVATISSDTASLHSSLGNRSYWNNLHKCKK